MILDPNKDLVIDVSNLSLECQKLPAVLNIYFTNKADVEKQRDLAKAKLKEIKALTYKRIKSDNTVKHTEKSLEAEIDTDMLVLDAQMELIEAEHAAATINGAVESMRAKKDMLIQLGADSRKEK